MANRVHVKNKVKAETFPPQIALPHPAEVRAYLRKHRELRKLLPAICAQVVQEFDNQAELSLEVYHDLEIEDSHLTLYVRQVKYDKDIMRRINRIWDAFEKDLTNTSGWFIITTDFRPPRGKHAV